MALPLSPGAAAAYLRLEHPHLVGTPDHWGPSAAHTVQRWDAEDRQLQQELARHVRTARVQLPGCAP